LTPRVDAPHLIASVTLADPDRLYQHVGREPPSVGTATALERISAIMPETEVGAELCAHFKAGWQAGYAPLGLKTAKFDEAIALVRAADAAFATFSEGRVPPAYSLDPPAQ